MWTRGNAWAACGDGTGALTCQHECNDYGTNVECAADVEVARPINCGAQGGYSIYCPELDELTFSQFVFWIEGCGGGGACDC